MDYEVELTREAEKVLNRLDGPIARRIISRILQLAKDPMDPRLSGPLTERHGVRKSRVGDWRILFQLDRENMRLLVATIDTRGQVYKHS